MQYEITHIISYLVTAETPDEALEKWNTNPQDVEILDERVEVNG